MSGAEAPQPIDHTKFLTATTPFNGRVREIIEREFPFIEQHAGDQIVRRRDYPFQAEVLDLFARHAATEARIETRISTGTPPDFRCYSIPEVCVGLTLLTGEEYKRDGREGVLTLGAYFPGDLSFEIGNAVYALYDRIREARPSEIRQALARVIALTVDGIFAPSSLREILGKLGATSTFSDIRDLQLLEDKSIAMVGVNIAGKPQNVGYMIWYREFLEFANAVTELPFQKVLAGYGRGYLNPNSHEAKEAVRSIYTTQQQIRRVDPKIQKMAEYYGIVEPPSNSASE